MKLFDSIISTLKKPFPEDESRFGTPKISGAISAFVFFFLYVFQPFGISTLESEKFVICLGFGITTFLATMAYEVTIGRFYRLYGGRARWTLGKWLMNNIGIMFCISLANFLYARILIFGYIQWDLFPQMIYATLMIGIIPLVALGGVILSKTEKKYQNIAEEINQQGNNESSDSSLIDESIFGIPVVQIKFVEALQNYVKIGYINDDGQSVNKTERATLKYVLTETEGSAIVKCHRSFLVNRKAIKSTSGNAQGLLLQLSDCDTVIPVSRNYIAAFRDS